jgi:STE24 endopeptidase
MGNAAVMGVIPFVRYILLSDLLLQTMTDEQIEAVFAHELGHVVHRHLTWSGVFVAVLLLAMTGPGSWVGDHLGSHIPSWMADVLPTVEMLAGMLILFGVITRFFERQADVYAARTMEWNKAPELGNTPADHVVGEHGAKLFGSALHRVAVINNIPISSRNLTHGSIADRIQYLRELSMDPSRTGRFDRFMMGLYVTLISVLVICGAWSMAVLFRP